MNINVFAHYWNMADSYGRIAFELSDAIERLDDWHVNRFGPFAPRQPMRMSIGGLLTGYPTAFQTFGEIAQVGPRIALTMFESSEAPVEWADPLNSCSSLIVPSPSQVTLFRAIGVTVPIYVHPLGIGPEFKYKMRRKKKKFRILAIGDRGRRKGAHLAMFAFVKAFGDREDVELVIKCRDYPGSIANENIRLISKDYTNAQMAKLYQSADLMVFPSAGEGFGLPPREAAATGALTIATTYLGTADHIAQWGIPLGFKMVKAWQGDPMWGDRSLDGDLGEWAEADVDALAELMTWVKELPIEVRNGLGKHYSNNIRRLYTWDDLALGVATAWERACQYADIQPA